MNNFLKNVILFFIFISVLTGCVSKGIEIEDISQKRALIPKLTGKVKAGILEGISNNDELLVFIKEEFPETVNKFSEYSIFIKNEKGTAVVLMCNKEGTKALIEDASCLGSVEGSSLFKKELPCEFQLDINDVCNKK